ncbi:MAG TPA: hypothetical protein VE593_11895 [Nitrososphaeraceae archaeon]|nr:hypothetical protein [Nitrososphaeraceae archaeon]
MGNSKESLMICAVTSALFAVAASSLVVFPAMAETIIGTVSNDKYNTNHGSDREIPVATGDLGLDKHLNSFYTCIKKAIKESKPVDPGTHSYFDDEPTKQEVIHCYKQIFTTERDKLP